MDEKIRFVFQVKLKIPMPFLLVAVALHSKRPIAPGLLAEAAVQAAAVKAADSSFLQIDGTPVV